MTSTLAYVFTALLVSLIGTEPPSTISAEPPPIIIAEPPDYITINLGDIWPVDINDHGEILAIANDDTNTALIWHDHTTITEIGPNLEVEAINNVGQVVGQSADGIPFIWDGNFTYLQPQTIGKALDVNDSGVIVGWYDTANGRCGAVWESNGYHCYNPLSSSSCWRPRLINNNGHIAGYWGEGDPYHFSPCWFWDGITLTHISAVCQLGAMNDHGDIVATTLAGDDYLFLWNEKGITFLQYESNVCEVIIKPVGISDNEDIVAEFLYFGNGCPIGMRRIRLWHENQMHTMTELITPCLLDIYPEYVQAMNTNGWFVGLGLQRLDRRYCGFLMRPRPSGDANCDGEVDYYHDYRYFPACMMSPESAPECVLLDTDKDGDIDLIDYAALQNAYTGF